MVIPDFMSHSLRKAQVSLWVEKAGKIELRHHSATVYSRVIVTVLLNARVSDDRFS